MNGHPCSEEAFQKARQEEGRRAYLSKLWPLDLSLVPCPHDTN
ncbi:MAG: hypothetical protein PHE26_05655 [Syntrophomonadaceae bacterium]|nr:hypothetical protein [Syntrophomonadaceae bacterium]